MTQVLPTDHGGAGRVFRIVVHGEHVAGLGHLFSKTGHPVVASFEPGESLGMVLYRSNGNGRPRRIRAVLARVSSFRPNSPPSLP